MDIELMQRERSKLERLEEEAHVWAFTTLGTFYWENFLIAEEYFNKKFKTTYNRRW